MDSVQKSEQFLEAIVEITHAVIAKERESIDSVTYHRLLEHGQLLILGVFRSDEL
jgi:hypothetical protein